MSTVCRWMKCLGFKYEVQKKGYYVDGHKKPSTIEYRKHFVSRYLTYERRAHRWIQIVAKESTEIENKGLVPRDSGYRYMSENGEKMVEYHVDSCTEFQERMNEVTKFGGNLSVRMKKEEKPLIMFGHNEAIFKQYLLTKKSWYGPDGMSVLVPKDDGQGVMISAFQSRELGFGVKLTQEQLDEINFVRRGKKYVDEEAAKKYKGNAIKTDLLCSPFVFEFDCGASNEGYWNYDRMVLQLEDCVDVLQCLYPQYDFLFLFDHSCGHDKQQPNGLNAENMLKNYGGQQTILRSTVIKEERGYLGPHSRTLKPGDVQHFTFQEDDCGPF